MTKPACQPRVLSLRSQSLVCNSCSWSTLLMEYHQSHFYFCGQVSVTLTFILNKYCTSEYSLFIFVFDVLFYKQPTCVGTCQHDIAKITSTIIQSVYKTLFKKNNLASVQNPDAAKCEFCVLLTQLFVKINLSIKWFFASIRSKCHAIAQFALGTMFWVIWLEQNVRVFRISLKIVNLCQIEFNTFLFGSHC